MRSPAPRRAVLAAVLSAVAAVVTAVAVPASAAPPSSSADEGPDKTLPAVPTSSAGGTGIGIRAAATLPEFLPIVNAIIGSTGDVAGELAALADVPTGIRSPDGSSIRAFSVDYDGLGGRFVASTTFSSEASADDAIVFYQATMTAAGFRPVADSGDAEGARADRTLRFENPNSPLDDAAVDIAVTDADSVEIELVVTDAIDPHALGAFTGWAAGLPTLNEAQVIEAAIEVAVDPTRSDLTLRLGTRFGYLGYSPDELAAAIRRALPDGGFSLDADADSGSGLALALRHVAIDELRCEIDGGAVHPATLLVSGLVRM